MPQIDPSSFASQLFWLAVTFTLLYVLLSRFVLPRLHGVIGTREGKLEGDLAAAEQFKNEAEEARNVYEKALSEARGKSQSLLAEAQATLDKSAAATHTQMDKTLATKMSDANATIAQAKAEAQTKLTPVAEEVAGMIVEKLIASRPAEQSVKNAVDAALRQHKA